MTSVGAAAHQRRLGAPPRRDLCHQASFAHLALSPGSGKFWDFRRSAGYVQHAESGCPRLAHLRCAHRGAWTRAHLRCAAGPPTAASCLLSTGHRRLASGRAAPISRALRTGCPRQAPGVSACRHSSFVPAASRVPQPRHNLQHPP